jgi:hypothetical protein
MARYERQVEKDKKRRERLDAVEAAMKSLPLKTGAESEIPKMKGLFEQAIRCYQQTPIAATTQSMAGRLAILAKGLGRSLIRREFASRHFETLGGRNRSGTNGGSFFFILKEAEGLE